MQYRTPTRRWLEVRLDTGEAFHQRILPIDQVPPDEVLYCDCAGVGIHTHNPHLPNAKDNEHFVPHVHGAEDTRADHQKDPLRAETADEWKARHTHARCNVRRQIFIDVTDRPDAQHGMKYDQATDTFSPWPTKENAAHAAPKP